MRPSDEEPKLSPLAPHHPIPFRVPPLPGSEEAPPPPIPGSEEAYRTSIVHDPDTGEMTSFVYFNSKSHAVATRPLVGLKRGGQQMWRTIIVKRRRLFGFKMWAAGSHVGDAAKAEDYHLMVVASVAVEGPERIARLVRRVNSGGSK